MRLKKHAFNALYEKRAFYQPLKSFVVTHYNPCIEIVLLKRTFDACSGKRLLYKAPILCMLLNVCTMCVNERMLNIRYLIHTFTMRLT